MITEDKIRIYLYYDANPEVFSHNSKPEHKHIFSEGDFLEIDSLIQDIIVTTKKLTTEAYAKQVQQKIQEIGLSQEAMELILEAYKKRSLKRCDEQDSIALQKGILGSLRGLSKRKKII